MDSLGLRRQLLYLLVSGEDSQKMFKKLTSAGFAVRESEWRTKPYPEEGVSSGPELFQLLS